MIDYIVSWVKFSNSFSDSSESSSIFLFTETVGLDAVVCFEGLPSRSDATYHVVRFKVSEKNF